MDRPGNNAKAIFIQRAAGAAAGPRRRAATRQPALESLEPRVLLSPTIFTVDSTGSGASGSGTSGTLPYVVAQANVNTNTGGSEIEFAPSVFTSRRTITLGATLTLSETAGPESIAGPGAGLLTLSGGGAVTDLDVAAGVAATISGMTISGGMSSGGSISGGTIVGGGGGLDNSGTVTLTGCTISGNTSSSGGGVCNAGTATLDGCTLVGNSGYNGGGVYNSQQATLMMTDCTVSGNKCDSNGGGIYTSGTATLTACTISGNTTGDGGGGLSGEPGKPTTLIDTIVVGNTLSNGVSPSEVSGTVTGTNNLIGSGGAAGLAGGSDGNIFVNGPTFVGLAPLGDYGGATQTIAVLPGSPALGAGTAVAGVASDERGEPLDSAPDIGAFQSQGFTITPADGSTPQQTTDGIAFADPLAVVVTADNPVEPVAGGVVDFAAPSSGASARVSTNAAAIGADDSASVLAADNSIAGSYTVNATVGPSPSATFNLTNLASSPVTTYTVDSAGGGLAGAGTSGTLPYVIYLADADADTSTGGITIQFDPSIFSTPQTITLGSTLTLSETVGPESIDGPGAGSLTIRGACAFTDLAVDTGVTATISGLTLVNGSASYYGGGLYNAGTVTLTGCTISGDSAMSGGGVFNAGTATLDGCTLSDDSAANYGGGVYNAYGATMTLSDCTVSGNTATNAGMFNAATMSISERPPRADVAANGGGICNGGTATLDDCTFSGNEAAVLGGGVYNGITGAIALTGCTISGNTAAGGGGLNNNGYIGYYGHAGGTATLTACTISGNSANAGGGLYGEAYSSTTLTDTIVAGNTGGQGAADVAGKVTGTYDLIGIGGSGGIAGGTDGNIALTSLDDLDLGPLAENGGPTQTMGLLSGSHAIGAGTAVAGLTTDQRGLPLDSLPDIGAFQTQGSPLILLTFSGISNRSITYGAPSVTVSGALASGSQAPVGETVAVTLGGVEQSATVGSGGAFSTTFNADRLSATGSPYEVTYAYASDGTFTVGGKSSSLTITPATLTITAGPQTKVYGTADPALAYTVSGFEFSDTAATVLTGALARADAGTQAGEHAGGYAISQGTLAADSNYTIGFTGATLTITPAALAVTANPQTKVYGTADPALGYTATGFINTTVDGVTIDDTATTILTGHLARAAGETVSGSPYAITPGTLTANSNYTIQFAGSSLSITQAAPTLSISAPGGAYTRSPIAARATVTGASGTAAGSLEGVTPTLTYYAGTSTSGTVLGSTAPSAAGMYTAVALFPGSADYTPAQSQPRSFVIAPAAGMIKLESSSSSPVYEQAVSFVATVSSSAGTPGGTVTFFDGATALVTVALNGSGQAMLSVTSLAPGSHAITARYNGAADFADTSSSTTTETVSQATTAIVLVAHPIVNGKKKLKGIELTAEIKPMAPGGSVPSGQVAFELVRKHGKKTQVKTLGTAELSGGEAALRFNPNRVLNKPLTIVYSGDPDFQSRTIRAPKLTRSEFARTGIQRDETA